MANANTLELAPLDATFGAQVTGVRLADLDDAGFAAVYEAWLEYALLIFPGQHLTAAEQIAFARRFGEPEFELAPISNVRADGSLRPPQGDDVVNILKGNMGWHADSTYMPVQAKGAVFTAHRVPESGGDTGWADMRAAHDALDAATRIRLESLSAFHSLRHSQALLGHAHSDASDYSGYGMTEATTPLRPLIKRHPETGRRSLLIGRHAYGIPGLDALESEQLLAELLEFSCRSPRTHHHHWQPGDAVVWDNRCLLHRARPWDLSQARVMYHSRIAGDPVTEFAAGQEA